MIAFLKEVFISSDESINPRINQIRTYPQINKKPVIDEHEHNRTYPCAFVHNFCALSIAFERIWKLNLMSFWKILVFLPRVLLKILSYEIVGKLFKQSDDFSVFFTPKMPERGVLGWVLIFFPEVSKFLRFFFAGCVYVCTKKIRKK